MNKVPMGRATTGFLAGITLVMTLALTHGVSVAGSPSNQTDDAEAAQTESVVASPAEAGGDSIMVHGALTFDVLESDGTPAGHVAFEGPMRIGLTTLIAHVLTRERTVGFWEVRFPSAAGAQGVCGSPETSDGEAFPYTCVITEAESPREWGPSATDNSFVVKSLRVAPATSSGDGRTIVLDGSLVALSTGTITSVDTALYSCPVSTVSCPTPTGTGLTRFTMTGPQVPLRTGQEIQVRVAIDFS